MTLCLIITLALSLAQTFMILGALLSTKKKPMVNGFHSVPTRGAGCGACAPILRFQTINPILKAI